MYFLESGTQASTRPSLPISIKMCSLCLWPLTSPCGTQCRCGMYFEGRGAGWNSGTKWLFSTWCPLLCTQKKKFQIEILDLTARCVVCNWQWCYRWSRLRSLTFHCMFTESDGKSPQITFLKNVYWCALHSWHDVVISLYSCGYLDKCRCCHVLSRNFQQLLDYKKCFIKLKYYH